MTEPMHQDLVANSSTSTRGPWSGHQIIPYRLSDAWKIKHSVAVMTADTVRTHLYVHIRRANQFQEIIHVIKINTHKSIHNTWYLHTKYKHEFCVCILYVLASMLVFTCILLVYTSTKHTNKSKIHTNTY